MGAYRGYSPNFLGVVRRLFRGGPPKKCQGAKIYSRTKRGDTVNYQLARSRLLGHTSVQRCAADILTGPSKALNLIRQLFLCSSSTFEQHYSHYKSSRAFKIEDFSC